MEQKIMEVLRRMQDSLQEGQLKELQVVLQVVLSNCSITQEKQELRVTDRSWLTLKNFSCRKHLKESLQAR